MERFRYVCGMAVIFLTGGLGYFGIEILWSGSSHPAMILVGGACFLLVGNLSEGRARALPVPVQALIGTAVITGMEFLSGCILNRWMRMNLWDYSALPWNILGQVCLLYSTLWYFLSYPLIWSYDWLYWKLCGGEKPRYSWKFG